MIEAKLIPQFIKSLNERGTGRWIQGSNATS